MKPEFSELLREIAHAPEIRLPRPGDRLGDYVIERALGAGGMGVVYLARDPAGAPVAIKLLQAMHASDREGRLRFEREAEAARRVSHPNVARVLAFDATAEQPFIVLEYVPGQSLRQTLPSAGLSWQTALSIAEQLAAAIGAAHRQGVVHRDLKPENVMLTAGGSVKVVDFGIAKLLGEQHDAPPPDAATAATRPMLGTRRYLAPEQAFAGNVDARADVFAFGVLLHELLTGRLPESQWGAAVRLPLGVPREVEAVLEKCLRTSPSDRYPDGHAVALALADARRAATRRRRVLTLLAAAAFSLVVGSFALGALAGAVRRLTPKPSPPPPPTAIEQAAPAPTSASACARRRSCCAALTSGSTPAPTPTPTPSYARRVCEQAARRDALVARSGVPESPHAQRACEHELSLVRTGLRHEPAPPPACATP